MKIKCKPSLSHGTLKPSPPLRFSHSLLCTYISANLLDTLIGFLSFSTASLLPGLAGSVQYKSYYTNIICNRYHHIPPLLYGYPLPGQDIYVTILHLQYTMYPCHP